MLHTYGPPWVSMYKQKRLAAIGAAQEAGQNLWLTDGRTDRPTDRCCVLPMSPRNPSDVGGQKDHPHTSGHYHGCAECEITAVRSSGSPLCLNRTCKMTDPLGHGHYRGFITFKKHNNSGDQLSGYLYCIYFISKISVRNRVWFHNRLSDDVPDRLIGTHPIICNN